MLEVAHADLAELKYDNSQYMKMCCGSKLDLLMHYKVDMLCNRKCKSLFHSAS